MALKSGGRMKHIESLRALYRTGNHFFLQFGEKNLIVNVVLIASSVLSSFFIGGIIFGFSALETILLVNEKAFFSLCETNESLPCDAQRQRLSLLINITTSIVSFSALPSGSFLDAYGPRVSACIGSLICGVGLYSLSIASQSSGSLYFVGFICLAFGGTAIFTSVNNFSEVYPKLSSSVLSLQTGAFQASPLVFHLWSLVSSKTALSFSQICLSYMVIPAAVFVISYLIFPNVAFGTEESPGHRGEPHRVWLISRLLLAKETGKRKESFVGESVFEPVSCETGVECPLLENEGRAPKPAELYNADIRQQILSSPFVVLSVVLGFFVLVLNYYLATAHDQLLSEAITIHKMEPESAMKSVGEAMDFLSPMLSVGGILGIPILSVAVTAFGLVSAFILQGVIMVSFLLCTLPGVVPLNMKLAGFVALGVNRSLTFGAAIMFIAQIFGFKNFGKLFGAVQLTTMVLAPLQYCIPFLVTSKLNGDFTGVNSILLAIQLALLLAVPVYLVYSVFSGCLIQPRLPCLDEGMLHEEGSESYSGFILSEDENQATVPLSLPQKK